MKTGTDKRRLAMVKQVDESNERSDGEGWEEKWS